ncbi:MAG TPA: hypothetical protein VFO52_04350 [Longimicrobiales bacterium]|nr:hypothetical protein [Longimicrobiales bacterium]
MKRIIMVAASALLACSAPQAVDPVVTHEHQLTADYARVATAETNAQLAAARAATARYQNIEQALADGFVDINVFMPGMGHHFLNEQRLDVNFEAGAPELLVYNLEPNGRYRLVALEYAVPTALTATPPAGFTGDADSWDENKTFSLWTLHAWVWLDNPDGVFAPFNPRLQ